jgi:DNA-binding CsgD family transcriptional regulator
MNNRRVPLTNAQLERMRRLRVGGATLRELAKEFGVTVEAVTQILRPLYRRECDK